MRRKKSKGKQGRAAAGNKKSINSKREQDRTVGNSKRTKSKGKKEDRAAAWDNKGKKS